ncbi:hypothetical protein T440DRAFT_17282 [Plenodomus tracheiphilus IPT5]|uniref:Protein kinase domain-containing protein n=1 Tax=Plenodomus tracheiphilus IPT5 TaxID=1408161 RepID=A0A6A7BE65_9PLEO|nr:hypothetical protein T440DRAFT_17282 [Plenodomus tracheiphilus IPT5]
MARSTQSANLVSDILRGLEGLQVKAFDLAIRSESQFFIPRPVLRDYLTLTRIRLLLKFRGVVEDIAQVVRDQYIAVFGILLRMGKWEHIIYFLRSDRFADNRLPFYECESWRPSCRNYYQDFIKAQWEFCAQGLKDGGLYDNELLDDQVMPITSMRSLKAGPDTLVDIVRVHRDYNYLVPKNRHGDPITSHFVLKTYRAAMADTYYTERRAYQMLTHPDIAGHIAHCYSSWKQKKNYYVLLEYADGGTLTDMFRQPHPVSPADKVEFWSGLLDTLKPLCRIHEHVDPRDKCKMIQGIHQDVKPDNIVASSATSTGSGFNRTWKLIDFGLTYFNGIDAPASDTRIRDGCGTQMFSAPECFRDEEDVFQQRNPRRAKPSKDMWSMGCVFSLAIVWCVLGPEQARLYQDRLASANVHRDGLRNTAYQGCFHDGEVMLQEVRDAHIEVLRVCGTLDPIVKFLVSIIEKMLGPAKSRPKAANVQASCQKALTQAKAILRQESSSPTSFSGYPSPSSNGLPNVVSLDASPGFGLGLQSSPLLQVQQNPRGIAWDSPMSASPTVASHTQTFANLLNKSDDAASSVVGSRVDKKHEEELDHADPQSSRAAQSSITQSHSGQSGSDSLLREQSHRRRSQRSAEDHLLTPLKVLDTDGGIIEKRVSETRHRRRRHSGRQKSQRTPYLFATINGVSDYIERKDQKPPPKYPIFEEELASLKDRDHIFLIDNSKSMKPFEQQVRRTFASLGYIVKRFDPDGIDLYFSRDAEHVRDKHRAKLLARLDDVNFHGAGSIENMLGKILSKFTDPSLLSSFLKPKNAWGVSIYVLTDGLWGCETEGNLCGIPELMQATVNKLPHRVGLGIQFIQFGHNKIGTWRLRELDNAWQNYGLDKDIIDHTHNEENVYKMLLGCFDTSWDNDHFFKDPNVSPSSRSRASAQLQVEPNFAKSPSVT